LRAKKNVIPRLVPKAATGIHGFDEVSRRRLVNGAAGLKSFEACQIDAVMDPVTGSTILLPEAHAALLGSESVCPEVVAADTKASRIAAIAQAATPNLLLAALPPKEYERLLAGFEHVELTCGDVLYESGEQMRHVYFPSDCVVSFLTVVDGHRPLEVGLVGREGMVGVRLALGITTASGRVLVQGTGMAVRISSVCFLRELHGSPMLQRALLHFTDALMLQITRTAACNRFHGLEARLARWLLMTRERLPSNEFYLTQEFIADMLGVRRAGVTAAACALQRRNLIRYRRGTITILDQQGLAGTACSCYQHVKVKGLEAAT
jgi:CRP-like cAMP-binding protein